jgi:hypothetical protein
VCVLRHPPCKIHHTCTVCVLTGGGGYRERRLEDPGSLESTLLRGERASERAFPCTIHTSCCIFVAGGEPARASERAFLACAMYLRVSTRHLTEQPCAADGHVCKMHGVCIVSWGTLLLGNARGMSGNAAFAVKDFTSAERELSVAVGLVQVSEMSV